MNITKQMIGHFEQRTAMHIRLVKKYAKILSKIIKMSDKTKSKFNKQLSNHDEDKYSKQLRQGYIFISWRYYVGDQKFKQMLGKVDQELLNRTTQKHVKRNKHHPEHWEFSDQPAINLTDRDKPLRLVDATKMDKISLAQMVCDWCAMSQERNNSPFDWAKQNINVRWKFTEQQMNFIYKCLKILWKK